MITIQQGNIDMEKLTYVSENINPDQAEMLRKCASDALKGYQQIKQKSFNNGKFEG